MSHAGAESVPHASSGAHPADQTDYAAISAWIDSGMPETAINYTEDAPRLTKDQLAEFEPASIVIKKPPR
jgi:hypothetical protein